MLSVFAQGPQFFGNASLRSLPITDKVPFWESVTTDGNGVPRSPGFEGPLISPYPWEQLVIAGMTLPGIVDVESCRPKRRIDNKKKAGADGSTPTSHGYDPAPLKFHWTVWTPEQWQFACAAFDVLFPKTAFRNGLEVDARGLPGKPFGVFHPALTAVNVSQVMLVGSSTWQPAKFAGGRVMEIDALEFRPTSSRKVATTTPKGVISIVPEYDQGGNQPPPGVRNASTHYESTNAQQSLPSNDPSVTAP